LRRFDKIKLAPGEVKTVSFTIDASDIAIWNRKMKLVSEPGTFDVMIARSADDVVLKQQLEYKD
jgi:beta-glucosidase